MSEPGEATQVAFSMYTNGPRIHEYLQEMKAVFAEYGDILTVGELPNTSDQKDVLKYISGGSPDLKMVFNFDTVYLGTKPGNGFIETFFDNNDFKRELTKWQTVIESGDAWTTMFLENHDQARSVSRFASDSAEHRVNAAKLLSIVLCALSGTAFLDQGQELGMINAPLTWPPETYKDVRSINYFNDVQERMHNDPQALENERRALQRVARDHARVAMQWDSTANAGFCNAHATPWMPALESCEEINVADQTFRRDSVLSFWREMLRLRRRHVELFVYGSFQLLESSTDVMLFTKHDANSSRKLLTVANLSKRAREWRAPAELDLDRFEMIASNDSRTDTDLGPFEARIYVGRSD